MPIGRLTPDSRPLPSHLVIQTSFVGDTVLTTPLIAHLAGTGPVDVVATPLAATLLANHPAIRRLVAWDKRGAGRGLRGLRRLADTVRAEDRDATAYCVQGSLRTALLARAAGYRHRVGFDTSAARWLYTRRIRYHAGAHHAERVLRLAVGHSDGFPPGAARPRLYPGASEGAAVDDLLDAGPASGLPLVVLAPGSVWATKRWPYFPELAAHLRVRARIAVAGSAEDGALAAAIVRATGASTVDATGRLSLLGSAELIRRAALLVTNDSAPQHLASAVGTPTLTLFGPTVEAFGFGPLAPGSATVGLEGLACRPCDRHGPARCPLGHFRCMRELGVERVAARALALLGAADA